MAAILAARKVYYIYLFLFLYLEKSYNQDNYASNLSDQLYICIFIFSNGKNCIAKTATMSDNLHIPILSFLFIKITMLE